MCGVRGVECVECVECVVCVVRGVRGVRGAAWGVVAYRCDTTNASAKSKTTGGAPSVVSILYPHYPSVPTPP